MGKYCTRNNELETYYTWIPRYEFRLDQVAQRASINFKEGTDNNVTAGYQIPEAFTFNGKQITGYWSTKYTVGSEIAPTFDTEVMATNSSISTKGITGTAVASGQIYNYYIDGDYKGQKTSSSDAFEFSGLSSNTEYIILVEIRKKTTNEYLGSIVKRIKTIDANVPSLLGFNTKETDASGNKLPVTYYVIYDSNGNEKVGTKITNDGSNMPNGWYDYSKSKWANVVVTDGNILNGNIADATKTTYFTWIPRYEFMITSSQYQQTATARTEVRFLQGTSTVTDLGYQIPEAFTFNGKQITGYWATKYTIGNQ